MTDENISINCRPKHAISIYVAQMLNVRKYDQFSPQKYCQLHSSIDFLVGSAFDLRENGIHATY